VSPSRLSWHRGRGGVGGGGGEGGLVFCLQAVRVASQGAKQCSFRYALVLTTRLLCRSQEVHWLKLGSEPHRTRAV
jgi:hypothetical protein